ncbi:MAG: hypothetical protein WCO55_05940 [Candidatus Falkowbacteria bacterium]
MSKKSLGIILIIVSLTILISAPAIGPFLNGNNSASMSDGSLLGGWVLTAIIALPLGLVGLLLLLLPNKK